MNEALQFKILERNLTNKKYLYQYFTSQNGSIEKRITGENRVFDSKYFVVIRKSIEEVLLPQGYPHSVSSDYMDYQIWDTVQAFCSTINGTLTTHAIFKGVGVGDSTATALSATVTWIMKDGTGLVGRIGFAWFKGHSLDADCKKWRLAADFINDAAMCIELLLGFSLLKNFSPLILCCSTSLKAIVGVAGGATRAAITQHQAIRNNMGDVSAKDGSQETCVNLIGSIVAIFLLAQIEAYPILIWTLFFVMTSLHLFANFKAVKSLKLNTLNASRLHILFKHFMDKSQNDKSCDGSDIATVNQSESVFVGYGLSDTDITGRKIYLGSSFDVVMKRTIFTKENLIKLRNIYKNKKYIIFDNNVDSIYIVLQINTTNEDIMMAYFHALFLGMTQKNSGLPVNERCYSNEIKIQCANAVEEKWNYFLRILKANNWNVNQHLLLVEDWRIDWSD